VIFRLGISTFPPRGCGDVHLVLHRGIRVSCDIAVVGEKSRLHSSWHCAGHLSVMACFRQLRQIAGDRARCAKLGKAPEGFDWLVPRFYRGKNGLRGLFTNSPLPSGDGPTECSEFDLCRVPKAGLKWRAQLRELIGTSRILERKLFIRIRHRRGITRGRSGIGLIPPLRER
jgi:hypothetical protein